MYEDMNKTSVRVLLNPVDLKKLNKLCKHYGGLNRSDMLRELIRRERQRTKQKKY